MKILARFALLLSIFTALPVNIVFWVITGKSFIFQVWDFLEEKAELRNYERF